MDQHPTSENQVNIPEDESCQAREAHQKLKKRILIAFVCMLAFAVVGLLALSALDHLGQAETPEEQETKHPPATIIYADADYDYDIMKDDAYLSLDRAIYYTDTRTNEKIIIEDKAIQNNNYGPAVKVLKKMVDAIIAGDHETYNDLFSSNYYAVDGRKPEEPFTMQQVYDIHFIRVDETDKSDKEFGRYTQYEFIVEYKIRRNNGTLHVGLDHDTTLKRYFVLSDSTETDVLIDQVGEFIYK